MFQVCSNEHSLSSSSSSSSSSLFVQIKQYMMYNNEQMIKPEQNSKVEKPHLLMLPLNIKRKKTQNLHNTLQLNTME